MVPWTGVQAVNVGEVNGLSREVSGVTSPSLSSFPRAWVNKCGLT